MVDSSDLIGLYIAIPLYFCFLLGAAVWGMLRIRRQKAAMAEEGVKEDNLTVHYLGGRSFNGFLTAGTMFASFFSGYSKFFFLYLQLTMAYDGIYRPTTHINTCGESWNVHQIDM